MATIMAPDGCSEALPAQNLHKCPKPGNPVTMPSSGMHMHLTGMDEHEMSIQGVTMRAGVRPTFMTSAALGSVLVWGAVEFIALQWSRFVERISR